MNDFIKQTSQFFVFISLVIIGFGLHNTFANSNTSSKASGDSVELDITLGRGPGCTSRGICKLKDAAKSQNEEVNAKGKLYYNEVDQLTLDIFKQSISDLTLDQQFVDDKFELTDTYTIPAEIMGQLGDSIDYTIAIGVYDVSETKDSFVIEF